MWLLKRRPYIKKTCDFCDQSAFGLMRRHDKGKTYCSAYCEAWSINCRMIEGPAIVPSPHSDFIAALRYP